MATPVDECLSGNGGREKGREVGPRKNRVLIVDDDPEVVKVMRIYLHTAGLEADIAGSGKDAMNAINELDVDAVILDLHMPGMDGFEVCKWIRVDKGNRTVPIIAITGFTSGEKKKKILAAGANAYMTKPIDMSKFVKLVRRLIAKSSPQSP